MSSPENMKEQKQALEQHVALIDGLPDDLAILCLSRVPRRFHHLIRHVSRRWRALLCSDEFYSCRSKLNLKETWIYAMCVNKYKLNCVYVLDPYHSSWQWKLLQPIPDECMCLEGMSLEVLGNKLYLLGGSTRHADASNEVYCYDTFTEKWEKAAPMPTARWSFLSATLGDKIYVTGGHCERSNFSNYWDIYDSHSNSWNSHQDLSLSPNMSKSFVFEDKLYIIHKTGIDPQYVRVRVYDPLNRKWQDANQQMSSYTRGSTTVVRDNLYLLDETYGTRLMMWESETKEWVPLGRLAHKLTNPPCQLVAVGRYIFMVGQKLSTVLVDTEKAGRAEGLLVTSSFVPKLDYDMSVISCKTIAI